MKPVSVFVFRSRFLKKVVAVNRPTEPARPHECSGAGGRASLPFAE
ncbi:MAG: hypothetical protein JXD21_03440 [Candidatus Omnitrophica bacterium]|nr:hypothetical protein [Candidatus Omnitrophota bacterium]